ncbi:hypothetical protein B8W72_03555 [Pseudomonas putida]|uniref:RHS repeat-associated core domain-containing protein n=1 Tax=Pseudomonas putida TaxID=303 RepID=A0A1Y3LMC5_PSEPU|nr:RHS repeat-associated core domain-containing protein [Pseudomonas putida]OUM37771.1 hypothetical protein B8W72_03555 [Pseudomonas putida]
MELIVGTNRIITRLFGKGSALVTLKKAAEQPLAEQSDGNNAGTSLLAVDSAGSVLCFKNTKREGKYRYSAYGCGLLYRAPLALGFNGEFLGLRTNRYGLGQGYREYDTRLMRFLSPDRLSPFGAGGMNTYSYCAGDPVNYHDPSGHMRDWVSFLFYRKRLASMRSQVKINIRNLTVETRSLRKYLKAYEKERTWDNLQDVHDASSRREEVKAKLDYFREQERLYQYKKMTARYPQQGEEAIQQMLLDKRKAHQEPEGVDNPAFDIRNA